MINNSLFGLKLAPLFSAIAMVESTKGKASQNVYQIDADGHGYTDDVNRILMQKCLFYGMTYRPFPAFAKNDRRASEAMMFVYWKFWGEHYEKKTGKIPSFEVLARIHNGGPLGWKKVATDVYWTKVRTVLETQTQADVDAWIGGAK